VQWLIDIVEDLLATKYGFFPMPETTGYDFPFSYWTQGSTWETIDFSSFVPVGTRAVVLSMVAVDSVGFKQIRFRSKAVSLSYPATGLRTTAFGGQARAEFVIPLDSNRQAEYAVQGSTFTDIGGSITGYFL